MADASASARASLAGNPSDGYGGAVVAIAFDAFAAEATVLPAAELQRASGTRNDLLDAAIGRFHRELAPDARVRDVRVTTTIPRSVGLGGSSAIVIAVLRALCAAHRVELGPVATAELALSIEVDDLGIAAGPQDRIAQSLGGLTFMEFGSQPPRYESLDPALLPPLLVAWQSESAAHSGGVHGELRDRWNGRDATVRAGMRRCAEAGRRARNAVCDGDRAGFREAVDASFDARREMMELDPRHLEMIERARGAGAAANYAGSGGAIVCVCDDQRHREAVALVLREAGCGTVEISSLTRTPGGPA